MDMFFLVMKFFNYYSLVEEIIYIIKYGVYNNNIKLCMIQCELRVMEISIREVQRREDVIWTQRGREEMRFDFEVKVKIEIG